MALASVYIEKDDETVAPPERVLKASFFSGGHDAAGRFMDPVVFFAIGNYEEGTFEDTFKSDASRQFSVTLRDLCAALGALGACDHIETAVDVRDPNAT